MVDRCPRSSGKGPLPMSMLPGTDIHRKKVRNVGRPPGLPGMKGPLMLRLAGGAAKLSPLAKKVAQTALGESGKRNKSFSFGIKSALASVASALMLKKILSTLRESSGFLGAVFKILNKTLLMALMPIATAIGAFLLPFTLQILEVVRKMLTSLKGPLADLIGGKIDVVEFIKIALPIMAEAFGDIGSILASAIEAFFILIETVWPMVEPYLLKAFDKLFGYLEGQAPWIAEKLTSLFGKITGFALPLVVEGIVRGIPIFLSTLWAALGGFTSGLIEGLGITWDTFKIGLLVVMGAALGGIGFALMGMPIAIAGFIALVAVAFATVAIKTAYDAGVKFGNFIRSLENTLSGIPGRILSVFLNLTRRIMSLNIGSGRPTKFAKGGIVTGPTLGMVGEEGPEAIIPLSKGGIGNMGGNYSFTINIDKPEISSEFDLEYVAQVVSDKIYGDIRRKTSW